MPLFDENECEIHMKSGDKSVPIYSVHLLFFLCFEYIHRSFRHK